MEYDFDGVDSFENPFLFVNKLWWHWKKTTTKNQKQYHTMRKYFLHLIKQYDHITMKEFNRNLRNEND